MERFRTVEFTCTFKMEVKVDDNATDEEIIEKIGENFDFVTEFGSTACSESDDYCAYMKIVNIQNIKIIE